MSGSIKTFLRIGFVHFHILSVEEISERLDQTLLTDLVPDSECSMVNLGGRGLARVGAWPS